MDKKSELTNKEVEERMNIMLRLTRFVEKRVILKGVLQEDIDKAIYERMIMEGLHHPEYLAKNKELFEKLFEKVKEYDKKVKK